MTENVGLSGDTTEGRVKWFDPVKGFGFIIARDGRGDVLLHANVLRQFGLGSVAEGSRVSFEVKDTPRGRQVARITDLEPPEPADDDLDHPLAEVDLSQPLCPARVKWFDRAKGFGFANVFGDRRDVFLHGEVLRRSGMADLAAGEAIALRVAEGARGLMASEIAAWDGADDPAG